MPVSLRHIETILPLGGDRTIISPAAEATASVTTPVPMITVAAPARSATASSSTPTPLLTVISPAVNATAQAGAHVPEVRVISPAAAATAARSNPAILTVSGTTVISPAASATAASTAPIPLLTVLPAASAATASSAAAVEIRVAAPAAAATAAVTAPIPEVRVVSGASSATASSPSLTATVTVGAVTAAATASRGTPIISTGQNVTVVAPAAAATASVAAPIPALTIFVAPNEIQRLRIVDDGGLAGTVTITFSGQTTNTIAYNAAASTVLTELEALSNINPGDIIVTQNVVTAPETLDVEVEFTGQYENVNVPTLVLNQGGLTGNWTATVSNIQSVSDQGMTAIASRAAPTVEIRMTAPAASATASSVAPVPEVRPVSPAASATASSTASLPTIRVVAPAAPATASRATPTVGSGTPKLIAAPPAIATAHVTQYAKVFLGNAATATASASAPVISINQPVNATIIVPARNATAARATPTIIRVPIHATIVVPVRVATAARGTVTVIHLGLKDISAPPAAATAASTAPTPKITVIIGLPFAGQGLMGLRARAEEVAPTVIIEPDPVPVEATVNAVRIDSVVTRV